MNELIVDKVSNSSTVSDAGSFGGYNSQLALLNHGGTKVIGPFDIPALLIRPDLRGFAISDQKERNKLMRDFLRRYPEFLVVERM